MTIHETGRVYDNYLISIKNFRLQSMLFRFILRTIYCRNQSGSTHGRA